VCRIWAITYAGDAPASYSRLANVRRRVWFVTPSWMGGSRALFRARFASPMVVARTRPLTGRWSSNSTGTACTKGGHDNPWG
jgi:hypothetical protein